MTLILIVGCCSKKSYYNPNKDHHTPCGFRNTSSNYKPPTVLDLYKWRWDRMWNSQEDTDTQFELAQNNAHYLQLNRKKPTLTWIGHATVLLQLDGVNIITDPQFSQRASPFTWVGPKRYVEPGISLDELPQIDVVVLSHDHYDSLDLSTVKKLNERSKGETIFLVPLGLKEWFNDIGVVQVKELDWWDEWEYKGLTFGALPVQHWSKRQLFGRNKSLWAAWGIKSKNFRFYFGGDMGLGDEQYLKETAKRWGPFDLAAIPIGAYEPRWFMKSHHINPEEALRVHQIINAKKSVAIHWGTFPLTDEPIKQPPLDLKKAMENSSVGPEDFLVLQHGQTLFLE